MKSNRILLTILAFLALTLNACAANSAKTPASAPAQGSSSADVVFAGVIESIQGDQMTVAGQTFSAAASGGTGSFQVGQYVQVRASVLADGSIQARDVKASAPQAASAPNQTNQTDPADQTGPNPTLTPEPFPSPTPALDPSATPLGSTPQEYVGVLQAISSTSVTVDTQTFTLSPTTIVDPLAQVGSLVTVHTLVNADGSITAIEVSLTSVSATPPGWNDNNNSGGVGGNPGTGTGTGTGTTDNDNDSNDNDSNDNDSNDNDSNDND